MGHPIIQFSGAQLGNANISARIQEFSSVEAGVSHLDYAQ